MTEHTFVADPAISIARGLPLAEDAGLGELALVGFIRQGTERGQRATHARTELGSWRSDAILSPFTPTRADRQAAEVR